MNPWQALTDLGDAAFLASFALGITLWIGLRTARSGVVLWLGAFGTAVILVALSKLAFLGWGIGIQALDFTGISGHAMLAGAVFPTLAFLGTYSATRWVRLGAVAAGCLLAAAIGVSRIILNAHSPAEVVLGLALGFGVAACVMRSISARASPTWRQVTPLLLAAMLVGSLACYGQRLHAQRWLVAIALEVSGRERPYTRWEWHSSRPTRQSGSPRASDSSRQID